MTIALTHATGIGPGTVKSLTENGFESVRQLADATIEQLSSVPGFSTARASKTIQAANALLPTPCATEGPDRKEMPVKIQEKAAKVAKKAAKAEKAAKKAAKKAQKKATKEATKAAKKAAKAAKKKAASKKNKDK